MQNSNDDIIQHLDNNQVWDFPGGVFPAQRKSLSNQTPIEKLPIPSLLYVTVKQHIGVEGHVIVEPGQAVLKGQPLTKSMNPFAVPVHASTSGKIVSISPHVSAHPSGFSELTVEIESDQQDTWTELSPMQDYQSQPKIQVLSAICDAGISGMGGAGFPTHIKASPNKNVEFLIINGIECEPYITSDDRLMREHAWQIRQGIDVLCHLLSPKQVLIGIEDNKPQAIEAMQVACRENQNYRVYEVPTKYPAGGEKQLVQILTNREVPADGLPVDVGIIMHNVGTCYAISDAIFAGKPLIERVVTATGDALEKPGNYWTLIGTPVAHLLTNAQYKESRQKQPQVIMGGPMMGFTVANDLVPVVKITNCILVPTDAEMAGNNEQACIRCGACADVCPASLLPQQLFWHAKAKELDKAQDYNLFDCIECGACAYVCPSEIPLVHYYRVAKSEIRAELDEKQKSDKARERFEKRAARLIADQQARDEKHRLAAEARKKAMAIKGGDATDKIAAALARAKAKKLAMTQPASDLPVATNTISASPETKTVPASSNQRVQAAIARAKAKKALQQTEKPELEQAELELEPAAELIPVEQTKKLQIENKDETKVVPTAVKSATADKRATADKKVTTARPTKRQPRSVASITNAVNTSLEASSVGQDKQTNITRAVANAKAKRQAQNKEPEQSQLNESITAEKQNATKPEAQSIDKQMELKKRRITAAVARAKAKKAALQALENKEDKSS
jgi:electron transport complex protein RnfC